MTVLVSFIHIVVCLFLIIVVLLQSGKAADLAGAFGGMGSQTTFGPRGSATVLSKATAISAGLFMVTSLSLTILATRGSSGSHSALPGAKPVSAPVKPAQPAVPPGVPLQQIPQPTQQQVPPPAKK